MLCVCIVCVHIEFVMSVCMLVCCVYVVCACVCVCVFLCVCVCVAYFVCCVRVFFIGMCVCVTCIHHYKYPPSAQQSPVGTPVQHCQLWHQMSVPWRYVKRLSQELVFHLHCAIHGVV